MKSTILGGVTGVLVVDERTKYALRMTRKQNRALFVFWRALGDWAGLRLGPLPPAGRRWGAALRRFSITAAPGPRARLHLTFLAAHPLTACPPTADSDSLLTSLTDSLCTSAELKRHLPPLEVVELVLLFAQDKARHVVATNTAGAALTVEGRLSAWGGADLPVIQLGETVVRLGQTDRSVVALTSTGRLLVWGGGDGSAADLSGTLFSSFCCNSVGLAAIRKEDGRVWTSCGQLPPELQNLRVRALSATAWCFAALTESGDVYMWGEAGEDGRRSRAPEPGWTRFEHIVSNGWFFAAADASGETVVCFGVPEEYSVRVEFDWGCPHCRNLWCSPSFFRRWVRTQIQHGGGAELPAWRPPHHTPDIGAFLCFPGLLPHDCLPPRRPGQGGPILLARSYSQGVVLVDTGGRRLCVWHQVNRCWEIRPSGVGLFCALEANPFAFVALTTDGQLSCGGQASQGGFLPPELVSLLSRERPTEVVGVHATGFTVLCTSGRLCRWGEGLDVLHTYGPCIPEHYH